MKKRVLAICIIIILLFSCIACGKAPSVDLAEDASSTPAPYELGMTYHEVYDPDTDFDNRFGRGTPGMVEMEDAYYFISTRGNYVYYYDKTAAERGVLCGKPECVHDEQEINETCNGFVRASGNGHINFYNGKLYYTGYSDFADSDIRQSLFTIDPDGANRERLFPFTCTFQYFPAGGAQIHRGKLYGGHSTTTVENADPQTTVNFSCWDLETGESKLIYERTGKTTTPLLKAFYFGKYVYLCDSYYCTEALERGCNVDILRWDTEEEKLEIIYHGENYSGVYYSIWVEEENRIFFAPMLDSDASTAAKVYCLSDGAVSTAAEVAGNHCVFLIDNAFVFINLVENAEERHAAITDFEGNILYDGKWSFEALRELPGEPDYGSPSAVYGDKDKLYIVYSVENERLAIGSWQCIVSYELRDGKIADSKLLCVSKW